MNDTHQCVISYAENIPLSLTTSTQVPLQVFKSENVACTSDLSSDRYFAVSDLDGHIVVYETKDLLKVCQWFHILYLMI